MEDTKPSGQLKQPLFPSVTAPRCTKEGQCALMTLMWEKPRRQLFGMNSEEIVRQALFSFSLRFNINDIQITIPTDTLPNPVENLPTRLEAACPSSLIATHGFSLTQSLYFISGGENIQGHQKEGANSWCAFPK